MSQCLWHHMGLIRRGRREEEGCRERSEAGGGGDFFFFLSNRTELCVCSGQTGSCECVCVRFPVEEPPWFHKHRRGIHSSRKTTAPLTACTAHTHTHSNTLIHMRTHSYTLIHMHTHFIIKLARWFLC